MKQPHTINRSKRSKDLQHIAYLAPVYSLLLKTFRDLFEITEGKKQDSWQKAECKATFDPCLSPDMEAGVHE